MPLTDFQKAKIGLFSFARLDSRGPSSLRYSIDCTGLRDPLGHKNLTKLHADGTAPEIMRWIKEGDKRVDAIISSVVMAVELAIEAGDERYVSVGFWDHHGKWIAPAIAELTAEALLVRDYPIILGHYGLGWKVR